MSNSQHKWTKHYAGFYTLDGSQFAVQADGYEKSQSVYAEAGTGYEGFAGGEWAVVKYPEGWDHTNHTGENMDWFPTMREAKAVAERMSA